jgi:hypothetical protein
VTFIVGQKEPVFEIPKRGYPLRRLRMVYRMDGFSVWRVPNLGLTYFAPRFNKLSGP